MLYLVENLVRRGLSIQDVCDQIDKVHKKEKAKKLKEKIKNVFHKNKKY